MRIPQRSYGIMKRLPFILLFIFSLLCSGLRAQELSGSLSAWIKTANTKEMAKNFDKRIDITINENADNYSGEQAEMILKDFLSKFSSRDFTVMHKGTSMDNAQYMIGTLKTNSGSYRTYIFIKRNGTISLIQEIRFEKE
jgi:Domain of unknown function (DUF4783)